MSFDFAKMLLLFDAKIKPYMARPTRYTPELTKRIRQYISDGLTVRDCCFGVGISEDTFCRWRREKPEFAKLVQEATEAQAWSSLGLARTSEYRRYTRRAKHAQNQAKSKKRSNTRLTPENALETPLNASERHSGVWLGANLANVADNTNQLPTRTKPPVDEFGELVCCSPYCNSTTNKVEWVERETYGRPILHRCSLEKWEELAKANRLLSVSIE